MWTLWAIAVLAVSLIYGSQQSGVLSKLKILQNALETERWSCKPFLPNLHVMSPPPPYHPAIRKATDKLDEYFKGRFAKGDIDGLSVAVVTSTGTLYEKNLGVMRGNETATSPLMTSHSIHRIASVSKLFTVLEGLTLEQKGFISWCESPTCCVCVNTDGMLIGMTQSRSTSAISNTAWIV